VNQPINAKRYLYLAALLALFGGGGYILAEGYDRVAHQANIRIGDVFPKLSVQAADGHTAALTENTKRFVVIVKKGCPYCERLEKRLDTLASRLPDTISAKVPVLVLALDEPVSTTLKNTFVFNQQSASLYFNATPQLYAINEQNIVTQKLMGDASTERLHGEFLRLLK